MYFIYVSAIWLMLYLCYWFVLRNLTFFNINRGYLLLSLVLGLVLPVLAPLIEIEKAYFVSSSVDFGVFLDSITLLANEANQKQDKIPTAQILILGIYAFGCLFMFLRLVLGFGKIYSLYQTGERISKANLTFVYSSVKHLPFSFFNAIFISKKLKFEDDFQKILNHEITHIKHKHSLDVLFLELLHVAFWFNPILIFFKKSLKDAHEFIADRNASSREGIQDYVQVLLGTSFTTLESSLANSFFNSQIKNRIIMLKLKKSNPSTQFRYLIIVPIIAVFTYFLSCTENSVTSDAKVVEDNKEVVSKIKNPVQNIPSLEFLIKADEMPRFPGCENVTEDKRDCSLMKLFDYIGDNLKYPEEAKSKGKEGTAVLSFVVLASGDIANINILRDPGYGTGKAAYDIISTFNSLSEKWTPGKQDGKAVNVQFTIPIKFKLNRDAETSPSK
jgi:bla regulator protein blaR1